MWALWARWEQELLQVKSLPDFYFVENRCGTLEHNLPSRRCQVEAGGVRGFHSSPCNARINTEGRCNVNICLV